ncbi:glucosaminidase domain-containing protein [Shewanella sp. Isolate11]|uniref:glucosaminidase domain-containing protein n=1 Tax=Shewanella sp. Isolate11 TaxID=2908530 RepID=UPI001EFD2D2A|nr:glucosaminidase domain-containing protein [Shewanella sp. Isolate11]MCG9696667.1 glucosaminidase domain-containing protein [Shewanella sp. Isolate11]
MKTGRINNVILSLTIVVVALLTLTLFVIDHDDDSSTKGKLVKNPTNNSIIPDFSAIADVAEKKRAFFDYLRPAISHHNAIIADERKFLLDSQQHMQDDQSLSQAEEFRILELASKYQFSMRTVTAEALDELIVRVDIVPENLVLIQAANETGWGSSRFAREGLNFFGQWCFKKGCGLVPQSRNAGANHEVAVFKSVDESVGSYMKNLNSNGAYAVLRAIRADLRAQEKPITANKLVYGLMNYSERQGAYVEELLEMLRHNDQFLVATNA